MERSGSGVTATFDRTTARDTRYVLQRRLEAGGEWRDVVTGDGPSLRDSDPPTGTTAYRVRTERGDAATRPAASPTPARTRAPT